MGNVKKKLSLACYRVVRWLVWVFSPKMKIAGLENLPEGPCLVVANHCQMYGPIACELYFPGNRYTWCAGQMMHRKEVAAYAFRDFWSMKPAHTLWFYKALSHIIAPISVCIFTNARTIGVYRDARIISTFKQTVNKLEEGARVVIFPEHDADYNHIINGFQDKFVDIARLYYKRTGKELHFVPMYIAPRLKKMVLGKPICFSPTAPVDAERERICQELMEAVTWLALTQPRHRVVTYRKKPHVKYPENIARQEEMPNEETGS